MSESRGLPPSLLDISNFSDGGLKEKIKSFLGVTSSTSYHRITSLLSPNVGPCQRHQKWHLVRNHSVNWRIRWVKSQPMKSHKFLGVPQQDRSWFFFQIHMSVFFILNNSISVHKLISKYIDGRRRSSRRSKSYVDDKNIHVDIDKNIYVDNKN